MNGQIITGRVDVGGHLVHADPPLMTLQRKAGAEIGDKIALPHLGRIIGLALLAQRDLRRSILLGDDDDVQIKAQAHIRFHGDGADIFLTNWQRRSAAPHQAAPITDMFGEGKSWSWETNANWHIIAMHSDDADLPVPVQWVGQEFTRLFSLNGHGESAEQWRIAAESHVAFEDIWGEAEDGLGQPRGFFLSGKPLSGPVGQFSGYRGKANWLEEDEFQGLLTEETNASASADLPFNHRVDAALRVPLNRIISSAETISGQFDGPIRSDYKRYAVDIAHAGRHLLALVDDLSDVQNIEKDDFRILVDQVELGELARRACAMLQGKAKAKSIRIIAPHSIQKVAAMGEYRRALQILINLIGNAIRYSPEGSKIWVEIGHDHGLAKITVTDQGAGIAAEDQGKIFEKYERLGQCDEGGSGLGLYIARRLAHAMGGDLQVEMGMAFGSRFILSLPSAA